MFQSRAQLAAENLFLRKQLACYVERQVRPRRTDNASRIALVLLSPFVDWRQLLAACIITTSWNLSRHRFLRSTAHYIPPPSASRRQQRFSGVMGIGRLGSRIAASVLPREPSFQNRISSRKNANTLLGFDPAAKTAISSCKGSTREVLRHNRRSCNGTLRASGETLPTGSARPPDALVLRRCPPSAAHVAERTAPAAVAHVLS